MYKKIQGKDNSSKYDPFKNDVYALGLSILEVGNGKSIKDIYNTNGTVDQAKLDAHVNTFSQKYKGEYLGNHGNFVMNSLQAIKHITSVDGGLLFLPHENLYKRGKLLRWYGIDRESNRKDFRCEANIEEWGFKFHMNDVNATIGMENFKHVKEITSKHKENAAYYDEALKNTPGIILLKRHSDRESSFWIYSILVDRKEDFYRYMKECGISTSQVHERNDKHTCVREFVCSLPNLDKTIGKMVSIPVGWWVTPEDRQYIVDTIKKGW